MQSRNSRSPTSKTEQTADVAEAKLGTNPSVEVQEQVSTEAKRLAEEKQDRLKYMAGLTFVTWFDKDGNKICQSWNDPERLIEIPEGQ